MHYFWMILILTLAQVLVLSHIHIMGVATPLMYVYLVLKFRRGTGHVLRLLLAFLTGLIVDTFANTQGLAAASMTLAAFVQPHILELFLKREDAPDFLPSFSSMGFLRFLSYSILVGGIFFITYFSLEAFSFHYWMDCLTGCFSSLLLTLFLVITIDSIRK